MTTFSFIFFQLLSCSFELIALHAAMPWYFCPFLNSSSMHCCYLFFIFCILTFVNNTLIAVSLYDLAFIFRSIHWRVGQQMDDSFTLTSVKKFIGNKRQCHPFNFLASLFTFALVFAQDFATWPDLALSHLSKFLKHILLSLLFLYYFVCHVFFSSWCYYWTHKIFSIYVHQFLDETSFTSKQPI